jgi:hypothetical protein
MTFYKKSTFNKSKKYGPVWLWWTIIMIVSYMLTFWLINPEVVYFP